MIPSYYCLVHYLVFLFSPLRLLGLTIAALLAGNLLSGVLGCSVYWWGVLWVVFTRLVCCLAVDLLVFCVV